MTKFFTVRFNDPEVDVQFQAIFKKRYQAIEYLQAIGEDGYIE